MNDSTVFVVLRTNGMDQRVCGIYRKENAADAWAYRMNGRWTNDSDPVYDVEEMDVIDDDDEDNVNDRINRGLSRQ